MQFAEVERLIDTPMKRYSSGLYARLGFSVAIHSNPDIVLVDEVLAVGDAAFRRRALDSLRRLIARRQDGRSSSRTTCGTCAGCAIRSSGWTRAAFARPATRPTIAERYIDEVNLRALANQDNALQSHRGGTGEIRYTAIDVVDGNGRPIHVVREGDRSIVRAAYDATVPVAVAGVSGRDRRRRHRRGGGDGDLVVGPRPQDARRRRHRSTASFDSLPLRPRQYVPQADDHRRAAAGLLRRRSPPGRDSRSSPPMEPVGSRRRRRRRHRDAAVPVRASRPSAVVA